MKSARLPKIMKMVGLGEKQKIKRVRLKKDGTPDKRYKENKHGTIN